MPEVQIADGGQQPSEPSQPSQPADKVKEHLENPPLPDKDRTELANKIKDGLLAQAKESNESYRKALEETQKTNDLLRGHIEKQQDDIGALRDLVASSMPGQTQEPSSQETPKPAAGYDMERMISEVTKNVTSHIDNRLVGVVTTVADMKAKSDRAEYSTQFGVKLSDVQHKAVTDLQAEHPTLDYIQAARLLSGDLAVSLSSAAQATQPGQQPGKPAAPAPPGQPQPVIPGAAPATPTGRDGDIGEEYTPNQVSQAAINAEKAGNISDSEELWVKRITGGVRDPHGSLDKLTGGVKRVRR